MKLIIALIQPHRVEAVKRELRKREIHRLTVLNASGYGRQKGQIKYFRGTELESNLIDKIEIQIAVNRKFVKPAIEGIIAGARSEEGGQTGDGKIFVIPLEECIRISDGVKGKDAI
ncbi:MAG: P-II family nitrogen regulator [Leptospiraceae bacterium]|nr:P-II family nitrogen regulator [Leptospiraceae bacterium]MCP5485903.1 P-II family nitrogen regulator [Spirochaetales bacterium]